MSVHHHTSDLIQRGSADLDPILRNFQKSPIPRQMAAIGGNINNLVQYITPGKKSRIVNGVSIWKNDYFTKCAASSTRTRVTNAPHFVDVDPTGTGLE